ncbi:GNAT family N-acetyltransferase [Streptomyces sp. HPF1205]|uniref:GNAT family N-acetyltransferase n=1 Tax=Streptomyces sp. HPF1205 TaxID=2873262 RepID=UPI001CEC8003|nr:GNAT family N-acetyltransferase [Streptomyces sp. HPF1205]
MGWTLTHSLDRFLDAAGGFLAADPTENSVPLSICAALRRQGMDTYGQEPPRFGWWEGPGGAVEAAYLRTPPYPPLLTRGTAQASAELARELGDAVAGVRGEKQAVLAYGDAWRERTGGQVTAGPDTRLYRLGELTPGTPVPPGRARTAGTADRTLLLRWQEEFARDVGTAMPGGERVLDDALAYGGRLLWELPDGEPVAQAGFTPPADGTSRILAVYTPEHHRGRGYGGAVTVAATRAALAAGATEVVLFTDLANPVSNALYRKLGYVPVRDFAELEFTAGVRSGRPGTEPLPA